MKLTLSKPIGRMSASAMPPLMRIKSGSSGIIGTDFDGSYWLKKNDLLLGLFNEKPDILGYSSLSVETRWMMHYGAAALNHFTHNKRYAIATNKSALLPPESIVAPFVSFFPTIRVNMPRLGCCSVGTRTNWVSVSPNGLRLFSSVLWSDLGDQILPSGKTRKKQRISKKIFSKSPQEVKIGVYTNDCYLAFDRGLLPEDIYSKLAVKILDYEVKQLMSTVSTLINFISGQTRIIRWGADKIQKIADRLCVAPDRLTPAMVYDLTTDINNLDFWREVCPSGTFHFFQCNISTNLFRSGHPQFSDVFRDQDRYLHSLAKCF